MRKKKKRESGGGGGWMDTYGDLVTLLLCFFVLLYSFSSVDASKWEALVKSFSGASGVLDNNNMGNGVGPIPIITVDPKDDLDVDPTVQPFPTLEIPETTPSAEPSPVPTKEPIKAPTPRPKPKPSSTPKPSQLVPLYNDLNNKLSANSNTVGVDIEHYNNEVRIRIVASVLFEPGSDTLTPQANEILTIIADLVDQYANKIKSLHTEGHTDNVSKLNSDIQSKWELAGRRAAHVLQYLCTNSKINSNQAYTMGYGSAKPVATNDTPEGRDKNNRVDIVIIE